MRRCCRLTRRRRSQSHQSLRRPSPSCLQSPARCACCSLRTFQLATLLHSHLARLPPMLLLAHSVRHALVETRFRWRLIAESLLSIFACFRDSATFNIIIFNGIAAASARGYRNCVCGLRCCGICSGTETDFSHAIHSLQRKTTFVALGRRQKSSLWHHL